jgi:prolyl-tRNA editing enzyme YbaK/EbsC (Cys-tRNA(Pro) deacylase)
MTDDRQRLEPLINLLNKAESRFSILAHTENISSAQEGASRGLGHISDMAPTFILKTNNGFLAAIIRGDTRLSYKKIKKEMHMKDVSLANPELVRQVTGAEIGSVALINPGIPTLVDVRLLEKDDVYGGCGIGGHTLKINTQDLVALTHARVFDFSEMKE